MSRLKNVCIIDDDDIYQFMMAKELLNTNKTNKILKFMNGREALDFFRDHFQKLNYLPDIIFLDLNMPEMDGWEFLDVFHTIAPLISKKIDIYLVSSSVNDKDFRKAQAISTVKDFITKPFTRERLLGVLNQ